MTTGFWGYLESGYKKSKEYLYPSETKICKKTVTVSANSGRGLSAGINFEAHCWSESCNSYINIQQPLFQKGTYDKERLSKLPCPKCKATNQKILNVVFHKCNFIRNYIEYRSLSSYDVSIESNEEKGEIPDSECADFYKSGYEITKIGVEVSTEKHKQLLKDKQLELNSLIEQIKSRNQRIVDLASSFPHSLPISISDVKNIESVELIEHLDHEINRHTYIYNEQASIIKGLESSREKFIEEHKLRHEEHIERISKAIEEFKQTLPSESQSQFEAEISSVMQKLKSDISINHVTQFHIYIDKMQMVSSDLQSIFTRFEKIRNDK